MNRRWIFEAAGAALILPLPFFESLIFPGSTLLLHHRLDFAHKIIAVLLDMCIFFVISIALLALVPRIAPMIRSIITGLLAGLVIWWVSFCAITLLNDTAILRNSEAFFISNRLEMVLLNLCMTIPMFTTALAVLKPGFTNRVARGLRQGIAAFSFCALWIVPQLLYLAFGLHPTPSFDHSTQTIQTASSNRIVWVIFDELSYDLVFEHPAAGETFPNFQRLRSESVSFADVKPTNFKTEQIIPSLLSGRQIGEIRANSNGGLLYLDPATHRWVSYDPVGTLFGTAQANGWNPGVAGWYNPYCRMFANVLTACSWQPGIQSKTPFEKLGASSQRSVLANALIIPRYFLELFLGLPDTSDSTTLNQNLEDYRAVMTEAHKLIQNGNIHFVFLHLPVPHPPGIFNRKTHELTTGGNYFDNLVLADDDMGSLMQQINQTPWAEQTTVIVSSDHSWRIPLWRGERYWTSEEERAAANGFDTRPVFLVHFPGQNIGHNILDQLPELMEHEVISSMLQHKIQNPEELISTLHESTPIPPAALKR